MVAEPVELLTRDGVVLRGLVGGDGDAWVVLAHDAGRDLDACERLAALLAARGYRTLRLDLRGHGLSDGPWNADAAWLDVVAGLDLAGSENAEQRFVIGVGTGSVAALVASQLGAADATVLVSAPPGADRLDAAWMRSSPAPKLLVCGSQDPVFRETAQAVMRRLRGPRILVKLPTAEQSHALLDGACSSQALGHVVDFIVKNRAIRPKGGTSLGPQPDPKEQKRWYDERYSGGLAGDELEEFLNGPESKWLLKLAVIKEDDWPSVTPIWYQWDGASFWVVGRKRSVWVQDLIRDPRCAICIEEKELPPVGGNRKVLAQCTAEIVEGPVTAEGSQWVAVADAMARRYAGQAGSEGLKTSYGWERYLVRLAPREGKVTTWKGVDWHRRYFDPGQRPDLDREGQ